MKSESRVIVLYDGSLLNKGKCINALKSYWDLTPSERLSFERLFKRYDLEEEYKSGNKNKSHES